MLRYANTLYKFGLLALIWCVSLPDSRGQVISDFSIQSRSINYSELLGKHQIEKCLQDKYGFYWLVAFQGVYRFDGQKTTFYAKELFGIKEEVSIYLAQDSDHNIWLFGRLGVNYRGNTLYPGSLQMLLPLTATDEEEGAQIETLSPPKVYKYEEVFVQDQQLYVLQEECRVYELSAKGLRFIFEISEDIQLFDIVWAPSEECYYYSSFEHLKRYDPFRQLETTLDLPISVYRINANTEGLMLYSKSLTIKSKIGAVVFLHFETDQVSPVYDFSPTFEIGYLVNGEEREWCFRDKNQLIFLEQEATTGDIDTLFTVPLNAVFEPDERPRIASNINGDYWFFFHHYIKVIRFQKQAFEAYLLDSIPYSVRDILPLNDSTLFISTYRGSQKLELPSGRITPLFDQRFNGFSPYKMTLLRDSLLYIGQHGRSIFCKNLLRNQDTVYLNKEVHGNEHGGSFLTPFADHRQRLWIASHPGIAKFDEQTNRPYFPKTPDLAGAQQLKIESVNNYQGNRLFWLATTTGGYLFDAEKEAIVDSIPVFADKHLDLIVPQGNDSLWILASGDNIYLWKIPEQDLDTIQLFRKEWQNELHSMIRDRAGAYWISSDNGLFRYQPISGKIHRFCQEKDGLPFNEFNKLAWRTLPDERIMLGGINGVIAFDPLSFSYLDEPAASQLRVQSFQYTKDEQKEYVPKVTFLLDDHQLILPSGFEQLQIRFGLTSPINEIDTRYYFRLKTIHENTPWTELEKGDLLLNRLSYGKHELQLAIKQGADQHFINQLSLNLWVATPWYLKWWSISAGLLLIIGLTRRVLRYRVYQVEEKNRKLKQLVKERTLEIEKDRLLIATQNEELARINSTKDKLFGLLGHELKAPLMGVIGLSKKAGFLIRKGNLEGLSKMSDQLDRYAINTQDTLQNLLNWGQVMTGESEAEIEEINLYALVVELIDKSAEKFKTKQIKCINEVPVDCILRFDREALQIILRNLLDNALKFSYPAGQITIAYRINSNDQARQISVIDEGIGMPAEMLNNQQKNTTFYARMGTKGEKGTGLGLHICLELAKQNESTLFFMANEPQGTIALLSEIISVK